MRKGTLYLSAMVLAVGLCTASVDCFAAPAKGGAAALQQENQAVEVAVFTDAQGNEVKVSTFSDGSIQVSINGVSIVGSGAMEALAAHGISLSVTPTGEITNVTTTAGTTVTQAPLPAAAAEAAAAEAAPVPAASILPANVAVGSGMQQQQQAAETQPSTPATGTPSSK